MSAYFGEMDRGIAAFCLALCLESRLSRENAVLTLVRLVLCFKCFKVAGCLYTQVSDDFDKVVILYNISQMNLWNVCFSFLKQVMLI